jgi:hypothetical protein
MPEINSTQTNFGSREKTLQKGRFPTISESKQISLPLWA